jgi:hypothetical protein
MSHVREIAASATVIEPEVSAYPAILAFLRSSSSLAIGVEWMRLFDVLRSTVAEGHVRSWPRTDSETAPPHCTHAHQVDWIIPKL